MPKPALKIAIAPASASGYDASYDNLLTALDRAHVLVDLLYGHVDDRHPADEEECLRIGLDHIGALLHEVEQIVNASSVTRRAAVSQ